MNRRTPVVLIVVLSACLLGLRPSPAAPRPPQPPLPELVRASFAERFDGCYTNGMTAAVVEVSGLGRLVESWSGYALERQGSVLPFVIAGVQDGHTNLHSSGAVRLWVKPDWSSASTGEGQGPGHAATLLELSVAGPGQTALAWTLQVSADGTAITLVGTGAKESGVMLQAAIAWTAGEWHQVILNYSAQGTALIVDGEFVAEGAGLLAVPPSVAVLAVGSSLTGQESFEGELEDVFCFVSPLRAAFEYGAFKAMAARGPITSEELAYRAELAAKWQVARALQAKEAEESGGGMQMLRLSGPSVDCVTNGPVYLTNVVCNFSTNDGWTIYFDIMGGTNEVDYDIFSTLELVGNDVTNAVWTWLETGRTCETHYFTNQATNQTFYILTVPGADRDGDSLYDGWEWKHFGTLAQTAAGDFDGDGVSNGEAYTNLLDSNQIKFTLDFGTRFVNGNSASGSILVSQGVPEQMAILVNSTNFEGVVWEPYQSIVTVSLGTTDGEYTVWVGLRGHAWDTLRVWQGVTITRDTVAPLLYLLQSVSNLTAQPIVQLQGYANEPLLAVRYDLTNAAGLQTNLAGYVTQQMLDTNTLKFTTNWFQCYDVALETNLNTLTVRVADLAGNVTSTNLNLTLDYSSDTNAPVITVTWPEDNAMVAGSDFTLRGQLDDGATSLVVNIGSNSIAGAVDRNGYFEIPGVPLEAATNALTLIATDAAGNRQTNTHAVRHSSETLTINPVSPSQLTGSTVIVSGTVGVSGQNVWVNGVAANVSGNNWTVTVPPPSGNVANFDVATGPTLVNPTAMQNFSIESPPQVRPVGYSEKFAYRFRTSNGGFRNFTRTQNWRAGIGGTSHQTSAALVFGSCEAGIVWPGNWPDQQSFAGDCSCLPLGTYGETTHIPWQKSYVHYAETTTGPDEGLVGIVTRVDSAERQTETILALHVGGEAKAGLTRLIRLTVAAVAYSLPGGLFTQSLADSEINLAETPGDVPLLAASTQLFGQTVTPTTTNAYVGELFVNLPAGSTKDLPFNVTGASAASVNIQAEEAKLALKSVTLSSTNGNYPILPDIGSLDYPTPHWTPTNRSPVLFVSGSRMQAQVVVSVANLPTNTPLVFKGETERGIIFYGTTNFVSGTNISVMAIADQPLTAGKVDFFNPLTIRWGVAIAGGVNFSEVGKSTNQVYVTLRPPAASILNYEFRHTVFHLACANSGATDEAQAIANTWSFFAGPANVKTWDGLPLTYYGTTNGGDNIVVSELLQNHDGQCYAFADLLLAAFRANGDTNAEQCVVFPSIGYDRFAIKNVNFSSAPTYPTEPDFKYAESDLNYTPAGISGQNTNPPQRKRFANHRIIRRGVGNYYDPSYGITTTDAADYTTNVAAWQRPDTKWRSAVGATNSLQFFP